MAGKKVRLQVAGWGQTTGAISEAARERHLGGRLGPEMELLLEPSSELQSVVLTEHSIAQRQEC